MKKFALYFLLIISYFGFNNIVADGIRLYQENDRACLKNAMLAGNKELLLPGDNLEEQVAKTTKFFGRKIILLKYLLKMTYQLVLLHIKKGTGQLAYKMDYRLSWRYSIV